MPQSCKGDSAVDIRLLNVRTLEFKIFRDNAPPYAIASHRWESDRDEVRFEDVRDRRNMHRVGFAKIKRLAEFVSRQDPPLTWLWIDTCCIDKSRSAELREAITMMYKWYENAEICVAYLNDAHSEQGMRDSLWFTRGWTLQELLAPPLVVFVSQEWRVIGHKAQDKYKGAASNMGPKLNILLATITGIPEQVIGDPEGRRSLSVYQMLEWTVNRETTRPEDLSYSLNGILEVVILPEYGEGETNARIRLLEAVKKARGYTQDGDLEMPDNQFRLPFDIGSIPVIEDHFVQCEDNFQALHRHFTAFSKDVQARRSKFVVHGLGGAGKSQLCAEFVKARHGSFSSVLWLDASSLDAVKRSLAGVAPRFLGSREREAQADEFLQADVDAVLRWLSNWDNKRWLVVFDGIDREWLTQPKDPQAFNYEDFLPSRDHGAVLLTTRLDRLYRPGASLSLNGTNLAIGREILEKAAGREIGVHGDLLVEKLGRLPLALAQAGNFLRREKISVSEYIKRYDSAWSYLMRSQEVGSGGAERSVLTTWKLSYDHVLLVNPPSAGLLDLWAFFSPDDVWSELLTCSASKLQHDDAPVWLRELAGPDYAFGRAVGVLGQYSLTTYQADHDRICINSLVHDWCLHNSTKHRRGDLFIYAAQFIENAIRCAEDAKSIETMRRLVPHARSLATRMPHRDQNKDGKLKNAYRLMGGLLSGWGHLTEADTFYELALQGYTKSQGPNNPSTLQIVGSIGMLRAAQGKPAEAEHLILRAHKELEKQLGSDDAAVLEMLVNLGAVHIDQARYAESEAIFRRALEGLERAPGPDKSSMLFAVGNLAAVLALTDSKDGLVEAEALCERALRDRREALGENHPLSLRAALQLVIIRADRAIEPPGQIEQECDYVLRDATEHLGPGHPVTLDALSLLTLLRVHYEPGYVNTNRPGAVAAAEEPLRRVLQGREKIDGPDGVSTLQAMAHLGTLFLDDDFDYDDDDNNGSKLTNARLIHGRLHKSRDALRALPPRHHVRIACNEFLFKFREVSDRPRETVPPPVPATSHESPQEQLRRQKRAMDSFSRRLPTVSFSGSSRRGSVASNHA